MSTGWTQPIYVSRFASWAPGLENSSLRAGTDWGEWALGKRKIESSAAVPPLDIASSPALCQNPKEFALFKRRLSQISRMTVQVLHDIMPAGENVKTVFVSFRGEITQQYKINRMLAAEGDVSPAAFSHSVFNAPVAAAAIILGLSPGYCAVYPPAGRFDTGFFAAASSIIAGNAQTVILAYADELCPPEYGNLCPQPNEPLAFAAVLTAANHQQGGIALTGESVPLDSPADFLKFLYTEKAKQ
jgi:hypothetical protein